MNSRTKIRHESKINYHPETGKKEIVPIRSKDISKGILCKLLKDPGIERDEFEDVL
jgi:predicted RNA binding protein YcfA (HicA-like mRNA interferase family)